MLIDLNDLDESSKIYSDICIIGSGVAGSILAKELIKTKNRITLIESGDLKPNELAQSLNQVTHVGVPFRKNFHNRVRQYGGACNIWPGRMMVYDRDDVVGRTWINESSWDIDYDDLNYYLNLTGEKFGIPNMDYIKPEFWNNKFSHTEKLLFNNEYLKPTVALWAKNIPRFGSTSNFYKNLIKADNLIIYTNATATEIELNEPKTKVSKVKLLNYKKCNFEVRSKLFIMACGGLENARLLLLSNKQNINGIGNNFDNVGRYFMEHPKVVYGQINFNEKINLDRLIGFPFEYGKCKIGIKISNKAQRKFGLLNSYLCLEPIVPSAMKNAYLQSINIVKRIMKKGYSGDRLDFTKKIAYIPNVIYELPPKEIMPHQMFVFSYYLKQILRQNIKNKFQIINYCEQEPNPNSRLYLSSEKDYFGKNKLIVDWKVGKREIDSLEFLHNKLDEQLIEHKIGTFNERINKETPIAFSDSSHHLGVTRMNNDYKKGVVDNHCKVHGISNLYILGSSIFPVSGHANPTFTIVAMSLRLADHLKSIKANNF